jgi:BTB/POZ domain-containing protein 11
MSSARTKQNVGAAPQTTKSSPFTVDVRAPASLPALGEWLRIALVMVEHRNITVVDEDDVKQTARLLLPGVDCPPRSLRLDESLCSSKQLDAEHCATQFQQDLGFHMLSCGRNDLVREAIPLLGKLGVNSFNMQGLSPLMYAAANGDDAMVQLLLQANANPNLSIPSGEQKGWTAVTFAVLHGQMAVVKTLLEARANPEGSYLHNQENTTDTPLQMASSAGELEIVGLLLAFGADPFLTTLHSNMTTTAANSQGWQGSGNSFAHAASDGHRKVLKKLLAQPPPSTRSCDMLSLEDILAEGYVHTQDRGPNMSRAKALQEALYLSSEHGFVDISMELRSLGVPWNLHCWTETVMAADRARKLELIVMLLRDFMSLSHEELTDEFCQNGLPLLFSLFRKYTVLFLMDVSM